MLEDPAFLEVVGRKEAFEGGSLPRVEVGALSKSVELGG